jgi:hypothetical protein
MKWFTLIILIPLLVACAQASPAAIQSASPPPPADTPARTEQSNAAANPTAQPGVVSLSDSQTQAAQSGNESASGSEIETPAPSIEWNTDPTTVVITATNCCGLVTPFYHANYIPDALVWGDGRILWVQTGPNGSRQVLQGQLSSTQLHDWLQGAADAGFFGWKGLYRGDLSPTDLPTRCITINLSGQNKQVCEYQQEAPEAFHTLYDELSQGLGATGKPFVPQRAYLTAHTLPQTNLGNDGGARSGKTPLWNKKAAGITLAEASNGAWLEGASLKQAWELVNQNPMAPAVMENGRVYQLTLQIQGISLAPPPVN